MSARTYLTAFAILAIGISACGRIAPGRRAPAFALKSIEGESVALKDLRGKAVLLCFWAPWAPPCRLTIPQLVRLQYRNDRECFRVMAISVERDAGPVKRYLRDIKANFTVLLADDEVMKGYFGEGDVKLPLMLLLDERGIILNRFVGYHASEDIGPMVERAVAGVKGKSRKSTD